MAPFTRREAFKRFSLLVAAAALPALPGCSSDSNSDSTSDGSADSGEDTGFDGSGSGATTDTGDSDAGSDTGSDTGTDTGSEDTTPPVDVEPVPGPTDEELLDGEPLPDGVESYDYTGEPGPANLFECGVASGDPTTDGIILWTRLSTAEPATPVEVFYEVADDADFTRRRTAGRFTTSSDRDFTVKVDVAGFRPRKRYFYRFLALGITSRTGQFRTAPEGDVSMLRFAVVSCSSYAHGYYHSYRQLADRSDLDAILHLGDYIYEYADGEYGNVRPLDPPNECLSLSDYRRRYAHHRRDADLADAHANHAFMTVWDDHETADNSFEDGAGNHDPVNDGAWSERKAAGIQAYFEWMPLREQADNRIFRTITYGNLAELVFLDTRLWGRDEQVPANSTEVTNPDRTLLGTDQEQWLAEQLTTSSSKWKLVAQQVMMGQWRSPGSGGNLGPIFNADGWDGYDAARSRIFSSIRAAAVDNVVVLTGDIHSSWAMDLTESPYDAAMYDPATGEGSLAVEFVTPAVTSPGFPRGLGATLATNLKRANPHMRFVELESRGYLIVDLDADKARGSWFHHNDVIRETVTTNRAAVVTTYAGRNRLIVEA